MTKLLLEIKDDRQVALLRAILRLLNIPIVKEEKENEQQQEQVQHLSQSVGTTPDRTEEPNQDVSFTHCRDPLSASAS